VLMLQEKGFTDVACLRGGLSAWALAGGAMANPQIPTDKGPG
jgi:rhodanese-related sulfurtransferase